ncbi:hypothetical protein ACFL35_18875 [Candidatus Riflebacteria bacterium]
MPVIQIKSLPITKEVEVGQIIQKICTNVATLLEIAPKRVRITWEIIDSNCYVEGEKLALAQPDDTHPPIVNVIMLEGRSLELIQKVLIQVATDISDSLKINSGNVFITYTEAQFGATYLKGSIRQPA